MFSCHLLKDNDLDFILQRVIQWKLIYATRKVVEVGQILVLVGSYSAYLG